MMLRSLLALLCVLTAPPAAAAQVLLEREPPRRFQTGNLPFHYDLYTFRGDAGRTLVVASFAVPAGELKAWKGRGEIRYRFDVSLELADTVRRSIYRTDDSVFVATSGPLAGEHLLFTYVEVNTPPSHTMVHRAIVTDASTPGMGQLYHSPFRIPDYGGSGLMLSDIALGQPRAGAGWQRGDVRLALLPTSRFPSSSFDVYYEVYNLPRGNRYVTEVRVEPIAAARGRHAVDNDAAVGLRFVGEADTRADGSLQELRQVDASLDSGRYLLTVVVTDEETGETARRSRLFEVRGWDPGSTLLTALPRSAFTPR